VITSDLLRAVFRSCPRERLDHFLEPLQAAADYAQLNTRPRVTMFLAQAAHESREFGALEESLYYTDAARVARIFRTAFDADRSGSISPGEIQDAVRYTRAPERLANRVYANRNGNGNEASGDGWRYRGRGIFQLTGKANYRACSIAMCGDADTLLVNPEFLADPDYACLSAAWYWDVHALNRWADLGEFETLTAQINPAKLGLTERVVYWKRCLEALA
jgi:putative chitinase